MMVEVGQTLRECQLLVAFHGVDRPLLKGRHWKATRDETPNLVIQLHGRIKVPTKYRLT